MKRTTSGGIGGAVALIVVAVIAAIAPLPPTAVERIYSRGVYPAMQPFVTGASSVVPIAILDIAIAGLLALLVVRYVRAGSRRAAVRAAGITILKAVAIVYLLFLVIWGLNYRRVPMEQKLDFDRARLTRERTFELASHGVLRLNALHAAAHAGKLNDRFAYAFAGAERALGATALTTLGTPKKSVLGYYFRYAAIDGMTNPIFLEVILNPDLLPVEQPEVLAHEWAHLAGYADESEANFVAWLTCLRGDGLAQYSGWLSAYRRAVSALPRELRSKLPPLQEGPRRDLEAIAARYRRSSPLVRRVAQETYDSYLKANRIEEGIANYDLVLQLMLGTTLGSNWAPMVGRGFAMPDVTAYRAGRGPPW